MTRVLLALGVIFFVLNALCAAWMVQVGDPVQAVINGLVAVFLGRGTIELWIVTDGGRR